MSSFDPLEYAKRCCETVMRRYRAEDLPPKGHFHYHQGVFLSGMYQTWQLCKEERYFNYIKDWVDSCMDEQGTILDYARWHLDDIQPGILLFPLWEQTKEVKYKNALDERIAIIDEFPRNGSGGFWHMEELAEQMWLDGLYMAGPVCAEYAYRFGKPEYLDLAIDQALLMQEKTKDKTTGLWYHAWDYSGKAEWANPLTGCSGEFWGRSIGWVPVAVLNELDFIPDTHPDYQSMCELVRDLLVSLCRYQTGSGLWYQVVNKPDQPGNWPEISCSSLYTAALYKAVRKGILEPDYLDYAQKGLDAVLNSLTADGEDIIIGGVCIGTGVGTYQHYCERPVAENDLHGVGAFLIMCTEAYAFGAADRHGGQNG